MAETIEKSCPKCDKMAEWNDYYYVWYCRYCETIYSDPITESPSIENIIKIDGRASAKQANKKQRQEYPNA